MSTDPSAGSTRALRLLTVARGDRHAATSRIRDAFNDAGAWITDVHFFSGVQTVFAFEVAAERLGALEAELLRRGMSLDDVGAASIRDAIREVVGEIQGTLVAMFADGDPDLTRDIPAIPG